MIETVQIFTKLSLTHVLKLQIELDLFLTAAAAPNKIKIKSCLIYFFSIREGKIVFLTVFIEVLTYWKKN